MSSNKAKNFLWGDEEGGAAGGVKARGSTNLSGRQFSTRDFSVDQSVNLMDMGGEPGTNLSGGTGNASASSFSVAGLFRGSISGTEAGFDEYGDAAASGEAEEYISDKQRRLNPFGALLAGVLNNKKMSAIAMACLAGVLVVVGVFKLVSRSSPRSEHTIKNFLIEAEITSKSVFNGSPKNAQNLALKWIVHEDPARLSTGDEGFLERYALAVFYFGSITSGWQDSDNWLSGSGICAWSGVSCAETEGEDMKNKNLSPIKISLTDNTTGGSIPSEFGHLSKLQILELTNNKLTGTLPGALSESTSLRDILIGNNSFIGSLPAAWMGLTNLRQLDLSGNQLEGTIPDSIEKLSELRSLSLATNLFTGQFPNLEEATRLVNLLLDDNDFDGPLPSWIERLMDLQNLRLSKNRFSGTIPSEFQKLKNLEEMHLNNNHFEGSIPDMFDHIPKIKNLHLELNKFTGSIPRTIWHLDALRQVSMYNNQLVGTISNMIGTLSDLRVLSLHLNELTGTIPESVGNMVDLERLTLSSNRFNGPIPTELGSCFRLNTLHLDSNRFSGTIPTTLGKLQKMTDMRLEINNLQNTEVPEGVCRAPDLKHLSADCSSKEISCGCCSQCS